MLYNSPVPYDYDEEYDNAASGAYEYIGQPTVLDLLGFNPKHVSISEESFEMHSGAFKYPVKIVYDSFGVDTARFKEIQKNTHQTLSIKDALRRAANGVVHDILITDKEWNLEDFLKFTESPPVGWEPFHAFLPGDYSYEKALVGVRVENPLTADRLALTEFTHNVDLPDVRDRGSHTFTTSDVETISFAKSFYEPAEVTATWKGGPEPALVEIITITETGFTARLRSLANPATLVNGTISWGAEGY